SGLPFPESWSALHPDDMRSPPNHAHNLFLEFGARFGWPGVGAAGLLTGLLIALAWRRGRWRYLALVGPVLLMTLLDYTLLYQGVLYPLIAGLALSPSVDAKGMQDRTRSLDAAPDASEPRGTLGTASPPNRLGRGR